jgi:hypothetical protein
MGPALHTPLYIGPGIGVGTIVIILLVLALVVFSLGVIVWIPIKRALRGGSGTTGERPRRRLSPAYVARLAMWLVVLCLYSWAVQHVVNGGRSLGGFTKPLKAFAEFPDKVGEVLASDALRNIPDSYLKLAPGFSPTNELQHDLYGLNGFWNAERDVWDIHMFNFRTDSVLHTWSIPRNAQGRTWQLDKAERLFENAPPMHSYVLPDRSVIAKLNKTPNLLKLDRASRIVWTNHDLIWHHCIQPSVDGHIWTCGSDIPYRVGKPSIGRRVVNLNGHKVPFQEDHIVKIDVNTGKILFRKGVGEILVENGLAGRLYGGLLQDPIHLNDCSPVMTDGPYWKRGDLFLSVRGRSMVLLYRPSENKVVRVVDGPLILEHDINVLDDHRISIFNNRAINSNQYPEEPEVHLPRSMSVPVDSLNHSQVLVYDLADSSFTPLYDDLMRSEDIQTLTQGMQDILSTGELFVEAQNIGKYYVLGPSGVVMRKVFATPVEGRVHGPNWTRIFEQRPWPASEDDPAHRGLLPYGNGASSTAAAGTNGVAHLPGPAPAPPGPVPSFLAVLFASLLLAIGILLLRPPFIALAGRTAKLVDTLLDREPDERVRQRKLIASATSEMRSLGWLFLLLAGVLLVAALPLFVVGGFSMAGMASIELLQGWNLGAMLLGTSLPFLFVSRFSSKSDYSDWSKLLHRIVLDNYHIGRYLFNRERERLKDRAADPAAVGPVIVSGLARAGTTALTTMLARSPAFHSLTYANMPFLLAPNLWRRFYTPKGDAAKERSHGDKVLFSLTSVEALEEYFFKVFLNDGYIHDNELVEHQVDPGTLQAYDDYQRILGPKDRPGSIYLAKNNNLILRYRSLKDHRPGLRTILLFRDPVEHAFSLMKQHARFSALQEKDPFVLEYMTWLGHHEFGKGLKHFAFADGPTLTPRGPEHIDHWLAVWVAYYTRLLKLIDGEEVLLVDYADLLKAPGTVVERIERYVGVKLDLGAIEPFENANAYTGERDEALVRKAMELHARLVDRAQRS